MIFEKKISYSTREKDHRYAPSTYKSRILCADKPIKKILGNQISRGEIRYMCIYLLNF